MKTQTLHMLAEADYICDLARQGYNFEDNERWAIKLLKDAFQGITDDQVTKILNGDAIITGWSICKDPKCGQCKGLVQSHYEEKADQKFKNKVTKRKLWLQGKYYKVDQFHIPKNLVRDYIETLANHFHALKRFDHGMNEEVKTMRMAFWNTLGYKYPSPDFMPKEDSLHYLYAKAINEFLKEIEIEVEKIWEDYRSFQYLFQDMDENNKLLKKYHVITKTKEPFKPKMQTHEGYILITAPDIENNEMERQINMPIEHLLNYLQERSRGDKAIEFTKSLESKLTKDKVIQRLINLQEKAGHIHTLLMHSMNLRHSESGHYDSNTFERYVNAIVQYFVLHEIIWNEDKISDIPQTIKITKKGDLYYNDKLIEERIDIR